MHVSELGGTHWRSLYRPAAVAAFAIALLLVGEIAVYASLPRAPTAGAVFELFHRSRLAGLLMFDLLGMISYLLFVPTMLALYGALRETDHAIAVVATALFFVGVADFFATNTAFPMLDLAGDYAAAATNANRRMLLAAGETMLRLFNENAFLVSYVIVSAAWATMSSVMLRSARFGRIAGWTGVAAGAAGILAVVLEHVLPRSAVGWAIGLYFAAIVALLAWVVLVGVRLLRLAAAATPSA